MPPQGREETGISVSLPAPASVHVMGGRPSSESAPNLPDPLGCTSEVLHYVIRFQRDQCQRRDQCRWSRILTAGLRLSITGGPLYNLWLSIWDTYAWAWINISLPLGLSRNTSNNLIVFFIDYVGRPDINEETIIDLSASRILDHIYPKDLLFSDTKMIYILMVLLGSFPPGIDIIIWQGEIKMNVWKLVRLLMWMLNAVYYYSMFEDSIFTVLHIINTRNKSIGFNQFK